VQCNLGQRRWNIYRNLHIVIVRAQSFAMYKDQVTSPRIASFRIAKHMGWATQLKLYYFSAKSRLDSQDAHPRLHCFALYFVCTSPTPLSRASSHFMPEICDSNPRPSHRVLKRGSIL
jgi:hypothetical protein